MSTSKSTIFMKKHERIQGHYIISAIFCIKFVFGTVWGFFLFLKNKPFLKSSYLKIYFVNQFVIMGRDEFNIYLRYSNHYNFQFYILCLNFLNNFLTVLGIFKYFNIATKKHLLKPLAIFIIKISLVNTIFGLKKNTLRFQVWFGP